VVAAGQTLGQLARVPAMIHKLATGDPTDVAKALTEVPPAEPPRLRLAVQRPVPRSGGTHDRCEAARRRQAGLAGVSRRGAGQTGSDPIDERLRSLGRARCTAGRLQSGPQRSAGPAGHGTFDSATPPNWAAEAAETLTNSRRLIFPGTGHEVALNTPDAATCFLEVMRSFYDDPAAYDTDCVPMLRIPPFITE